jgi:predicted site-specific integrase-resolvase
MTKEYYTFKDLTAKLGIPIKTLRRWDSERKIAGRLKAGHHVLFKCTEIDKRLLKDNFLIGGEA